MSDNRPERGAPELDDLDDDLPPMLVIGEDRPEVEDTTAQKLARQQAELERRRRQLEEEDRRRREEAEQEAEELRRQAEERLARERREAEVELTRRQREIDDAERRLERSRRRLQKQQGGPVPGAGKDRERTSPRKEARDQDNRLLAAVDRRSGKPVPRLGRAAGLAVLAGVLVAIGAPLSVDPPSQGAVEDFVALDQARVAWMETGLVLDQDVVSYLGGDDVVTGEGVVPSVAMAKELSEPDAFYLDRFTEGVGPLLAEPGSTPQRVLSAWTDAREATAYGVSTSEIDRAAEKVDTDRHLPTWLLLGSIVAIGTLTYGLARGGTRVGAGLAGLALVPAGLLLLNDDRHLDVEEPIARHGTAIEGADGIYTQLARDLEVVLGTRSLDSYEREDYWDRSYRLEELDPAQGYAEVRSELAGIDLRSLPLEGSLPHAEALIAAGDASLAAQQGRVAETRDEVLAHTESDVDLGPYLTSAIAAGLLPLAALVPAVLRRREVTG